MKEIKEEFKKEVVDTHIYYEADDGTRFDSKEECSKYEDTVFCVLMARAKSKELSDSSYFPCMFCAIASTSQPLSRYGL